jgi:hypothetical protein
MHRAITYLQSKPVFLYLLPVFFVLHGFAENFYVLPLKEGMVLTVSYLAIAFVLSIVFRLIYKNVHKANLIAFFLMAFNFFFGSMHDLLKKHFGHSIISKYSFILPVSLVLLLALLIYLKKTKTGSSRTTRYLNWLFLLLIIIDSGAIAFKALKHTDPLVADLSGTFKPCDACTRLDIYLIVSDEYAGKTELQDNFSFDNSDFENELARRGFHVVRNTKANYNYTVYSMASTFNMDYLHHLEQDTINQRDMFRCRALIKKNNLLSFLRSAGYRTYNFSIFDFDNQQNPVTDYYFPSKKALFTSQTFIKRFQHDLGFHFVSTRQLKNFRRSNLYNNIEVDSLTRDVCLKKDTRPKFVYAHLSMPHHPYFLDRNGKEAVYNTILNNYVLNKNAYIEYLLYTNKKLLQLVDHIQQASARPPIIILMSDHGFRQFSDSTDKKYYFMNLNAVYFPDGNYTGFYEGMSNVNQFRVILNTEFRQQLPLLKDSTVFLGEPDSQ